MNPSEPGVRGRAWLVVGCAALFSVDKFFLIVFPSVIVEDLAHAFAISPLDIASLLSVMLFTILLVQLPAGFLVNRVGPRWALSGAAAVCAAGLLLFATSRSFAVAFLARIVIGFGASFSLVGSAALIGNWLPKRLFAFALGAVQAATMAATVGGNLALAQFTQALGWRDAVLVLGAGNAGLALLLWLVVRDVPPDEQFAQISGDTPREHAGLADLVLVAKNPQTWLQGLYEACAYGPIVAVTGLWEIAQLRASYGLSLTAATGIDDMVYVGFGIGAPTIGALAAYLGRRRMLMIASGAVLTACYLWPVATPALSPLLDSVRLGMIGFFASSNVLAFATAKDLFSARARDLVVVFVNLIGIVGTMILPLLIGWLLTLRTPGPGGSYTADDFAAVLNVVLPICGGVSLLAALGTTETLRKSAS